MSTRGSASGPKRMLLICGLRDDERERRGDSVPDDEQGGTHRMSQLNIIESGVRAVWAGVCGAGGRGRERRAFAESF